MKKADWILSAFFVLMASPGAHAGELLLTVSTYTAHLSRQPLNDRTFGAGIGYQVTPRLEALAGAFENSYSRTSRYLVGVAWVTPDDALRVGVAAGYLDGYPDRAPVGFALVGALGPARLVVHGGSLSLWFAVPLEL